MNTDVIRALMDAIDAAESAQLMTEDDGVYECCSDIVEYLKCAVRVELAIDDVDPDEDEDEDEDEDLVN